MAVVNLGPEYDTGLHRTLISVLKDFGAQTEPPQWAVGGSQEIVIQVALLEGERIKIESETFMGLTLEGDAAILDRIASEVRARLAIG